MVLLLTHQRDVPANGVGGIAPVVLPPVLVADKEPAMALRLELYARAIGQIEAIVADADPRPAEDKLAAVRQALTWIEEEETHRHDRLAAASSKVFEAVTEQQQRWLDGF